MRVKTGWHRRSAHLPAVSLLAPTLPGVAHIIVGVAAVAVAAAVVCVVSLGCGRGQRAKWGHDRK